MAGEQQTPERRFRDFDAAFAEQQLPPVELKLHGRVWQLPGALPSAAVLIVARWVNAGRAQPGSPAPELTNAELMGLAEAMVPAETLRAWQAKGLDIDQLGEIVEWLFEQYRDQIQEAFAPGGGVAPPTEETASTSSTSPSDGGASSRPTSTGSTTSSSPAA